MQREGGDERKKHENVKLKEEDVPGASLPREKPEECTVKQLMNRTQVLNTKGQFTKFGFC